MSEDLTAQRGAGRLQLRRRLRRGWTAKKEKHFFEVLAETANVSFSAAEVGMLPSSVYKRRKVSEAFEAGYREAINAGVAQLEAAVLDAALNGIETPIIHAGEIRGSKRVFSERLAIFLLKAHKPQLYGPTPLRMRFEEDGLPPPVANVDEARARILRLMDEIDSRAAEDCGAIIEVKAGRPLIAIARRVRG